MATSKPSVTNCPFTFPQARTGRVYTFSGPLENGRHLKFYFSSCHNPIQVVIARGFHLFPFRTEKLSFAAPMVLRNSGRVGSRRFLRSPLILFESRGFPVFYRFRIRAFLRIFLTAVSRGTGKIMWASQKIVSLPSKNSHD